MTRSLEEIVWAVDPAHDSLDSIANYLGRFAQDFLSAAGISCRLDLPGATAGPAHCGRGAAQSASWPSRKRLNNVVRHSGAREVNITLSVTATRFILSIADDGKGFAPALASASPSGRSGHGLANIRSRLAEIGGEAEIASEPSQGTRVRLLAPLPADSATASLKLTRCIPPDQTIILPLMPVRISIIEDDAPLRRIFTSWVRRAPDLQLVGEYADAETALAAMPADQPDVVLADINLPGMNGIECVRQLKEQLPQTQFMMLTVYEDAEKIFSALEAGASGYLLKRTSEPELLAAIADLWQRRLAHDQRHCPQGGAVFPQATAQRAPRRPRRNSRRAKRKSWNCSRAAIFTRRSPSKLQDQRADGEPPYPEHVREAARSFPVPGGGQVSRHYESCRPNLATPSPDRRPANETKFETRRRRFAALRISGIRRRYRTASPSRARTSSTSKAKWCPCAASISAAG